MELSYSNHIPRILYIFFLIKFSFLGVVDLEVVCGWKGVGRHTIQIPGDSVNRGDQGVVKKETENYIKNYIFL